MVSRWLYCYFDGFIGFHDDHTGFLDADIGFLGDYIGFQGGCMGFLGGYVFPKRLYGFPRWFIWMSRCLWVIVTQDIIYNNNYKESYKKNETISYSNKRKTIMIVMIIVLKIPSHHN
jgi:hypothetical protein